jgi:hypothetical protein
LLGLNDEQIAKLGFGLIGEGVINREMTEYTIQDGGMKVETCKMIPRVWDMQLGYENLQYGYENMQVQGLIQMK